MTLLTAPTLALLNDTGAQSSDLITRDATISVGSLDPAATWQYSLDGGLSWIAGAGAAIPGSAFATDGDYTIQVRQVDAGGLPGSVASLHFLLDTIVAAPTLSLRSDTGVSATDGITNNATVAIAGLEAGATWRYSLDGGSTWRNGAGTSIAASAFADGHNSVLVEQTDLAGNVARSAAFSFTADHEVNQPVVTLKNDSGSSASDRLTNDAALVISGLEVGATWHYSLDGGSTWIDGVGNEIPASTFGADGSKTVLVTQIDAAGNESNGSLLYFRLDTSAPVAPVAVLLNDTGTSASDGITADATVAVSSLEAGARWQYSVDGGGHWIDGTGNSVPASAYTQDGLCAVQVRQIDAAGNTSEAASLNFRLDTAAPAAPQLALALDSGLSSSDAITSTAHVLIDGVETGATVQYRLADTDAWTTVEGDLDDSAFPQDGLYQVQVRQIDAAGNTSATSTLTLHRDTTAPVAPSIALTTDSGHSDTDQITNTAGVTVSGIEAGASWRYHVGDGQWKTSADGVIAASEFTGDGQQVVAVQVTDAAGNMVEQSFDFTLVSHAAPIDLSDLDGVQSTLSKLCVSGELNKGVALTALTGALSADAMHTLTIALDGPGLDKAGDTLVLDQTVALDTDAAADNVTIGGLTGFSYRYVAATGTLTLSRTDGGDFSGSDAAGLTNAILLRNAAAVPQDGTRTLTLSYVDIAGNASAPGVISITEDRRLPALDLNGAAAGIDQWRAVSAIGAPVAIFAADAALVHANPDATFSKVSVAMTGASASKDDALVSSDGQGGWTTLAAGTTQFSLAGVAWTAERSSDTFVIGRTDGTTATQAQMQDLLRSLQLRNALSNALEGERDFHVIVTDHLGRSAQAGATLVLDRSAPALDANGTRAPGTDYATAFTAGVPWAIALAHPSTAFFSDATGAQALTLSFGSGPGGAFDGSTTNRAEFVGLSDGDDSDGMAGALRLGQAGTVTLSNLIEGKTLTLTMGGAANTQFSITSDLPLSADEASIVLRSLRYSAEGSTSLGARTVAFTATDPAGNLVAGVNTTLTVQAPGSPMVFLDPSSDSGRFQSDNVTRQNGSGQAPLTLTGFAGSGQTVTVFTDANGNGAMDGGESLGTAVADSAGRWTLTVANRTFADGDHKFMASAGGKTSWALEVTVDTQAPPMTMSLGSSVHVKPVITGSADAGARVTVELDTDGNTANGYEVRYQTTADKAGHWSLDTASAKPVSGSAFVYAHDQAVNVRASSADLAGNTTQLIASGNAQASLYSISDSQVIEGTSGVRYMHFVVTRSGDVSEAGTVQFAVDSAASSAKAIVGGAPADNDYSGAGTGTVSFAAGETSKVISFTVNGDHYREVNDKLVVNLRTPTNGAISDGIGVGTINEVDVNRLQAAYGLRDLNPSSNDYAVRVRRSSDNAERDIGFDANGNLDQKALLDFVGRTTSNKGFVTKWYDQSGHGVDMLQTDMTKQGVIVDAGKAVTRADGSIAISFNNGRNGANNDYMVANGVAANDWKSTVLYTKVQSEGNANGSLFNLGDANVGRLSSHYPAFNNYYFDVNNYTSSGAGRLQQTVPGGGAALLGKPTDVVFEAHAGNTTAGTAAVNYTDGKQVIFDAGVRVASDATLANQFSTTNEWKLAWHGAYGSSDSNYYQQAMYNEFLVFLDKDGKATPTMQSLMGSAGADVLNYNGEAGLTLIDGQGGYDRLAVHGASLDTTQLPIQGIEEIALTGSDVQTLTLTDASLLRNGASSLTIHMEAGDAVLLNGTRFTFDASSLQSMVIGSNKADVIMSTPRNDLMIGGAGADTFTWLPNHGGRDTVQDYSSAQGDKLDLGQLLRGFTAGSEAQFLQKVVDVNGNVSLQVDWNGQADFNHADLTIVLNNVHATDPITVLTGTGSVIL